MRLVPFGKPGWPCHPILGLSESCNPERAIWSQRAHMSQVPERCAREYRIDRLLARGGFGEVYLAVQVSLGRPVVVKLLLPESAADPDLLRRFQDEARITATLTDPHVVVVIDHDVENGVPWIVYEYLAGRNLRDILQGGPLDWRYGFQIGIQITQALAAAHSKGVIHRDIKPENVLETRPGVFKVADFGLAKWTAGAVQTATGLVLGTPAYMAPEQFSGWCGPSGDLYSVGVLLFELLVGRRPFDDEDPASVIRHHLQTPPPHPSVLRPEIPRAAADVVLRALEKDPDRRQPSAAALLQELEAQLTPVVAPEKPGVTVRLSGPVDGLGRREAIRPAAAPAGVEPTVTSRRPPAARLSPFFVLAGLLVVGLICVQLWRSGPEGTAPIPEAVLTPVRQLLGAEMAASAEQRALELRSTYGNVAELEHLIGLARIRQDQLDAAESGLQAALRTHPGDANLLYDRGVIAMRRGDLPTARSYFTAALKAHPRHGRANALLGIMTIDPVAKESFLQTAAAATPALFDVHYYMGYIHQTNGRSQEARSEYQRAIEPEKAVLADHYAHADTTLGTRPDQWTRLRIDIQSDAVAHEADMLAREGKRGVAEQELRRACKRYPDAGRLHRLLAQLLAARGAHSDARREARLALTLSRQDWLHVQGCCDILTLTGDPVASEAGLRRAIVDHPHTPGPVTILVEMLRNRTGWTEAKSVVSAALNRMPKCADLLILWGIYLVDEGRGKEAVANFRRLLIQDPKNASAQFNLARALEQLGDDRAAEKAYRDFLSLQPNSVIGLAARAQMLERLKRPGEAEELLKRALQLSPGDKRIRRQLEVLRLWNSPAPGSPDR
jgi:Flp pilus assembly protein TadD/tRNA A-37 threonylcarbamoyl transferase component Bud32